MRVPLRSGGGGARIGVLFLKAGPNEFLVCGTGDAQISFTAETPGPPIVGIESIDEMYVSADGMTKGRRMNGDESSQGQALKLSAG